MLEQNENNMPEVENGIEMRDDSGKKPETAAIVKIAVVAVALLLAFIAFTQLGQKKRSLEETIAALQTEAAKYTTSDDVNGMLSVFFPGKRAKQLSAEQSSYYTDAADTYKYVTKITKLDETELSVYTQGLQAVVEDRLQQELGSLYSSELVKACRIVSVQCDYQNANAVYSLIAYPYKKTWYVLPQIYDDICSAQVSTDLESAQKIATAFATALAQEELANGFADYLAAPINLDTDFTYLPPKFQETVLACLEGSIPVVAYGRQQTNGFSVYVDANYSVAVYVADAKSKLQWKLYPVMQPEQERYLAGERDETQPDISYENGALQLISSQSPLIGYWQAEGAGMYIGYDTSGGTEGLAAYVQTQAGMQILTARDPDFTLIKQDGSLLYQGSGWINTEYKPVQYGITPQADGTVMLQVQVTDEAHTAVESETVYTLTSGTVGRDVLDRLAGNYRCGTDWSDLTADECVWQYDEACGLVHAVYDGGCSFAARPTVVLYDGINTIHYVMPSQGLYVAEQERVCYEGKRYRMLDADTVFVDEYLIGGGGGQTYQYYRSGSVAWEKQKVALHFEKYISDCNVDIDACTFEDLNADGIPEFIYQKYDEVSILYYRADEEVVAKVCPPFDYAKLAYRKGKGEFKLTGYNGGMEEDETYYEFDGTDIVCTGSAVKYLSDLDHIWKYSINYAPDTEDAKEVSEAEYKSFVDSFDTYESEPDLAYEYLRTAYEAYFLPDTAGTQE